MGGSSILPPSGSSLCAGAGGGNSGGIHPTADDLFFTPDATYYVGYDSSAGVWGRPVYVYASTGLALGGTTPNTSLVTLGTIPAGLSNDYGVYTPNVTDTLSLWSTRTSGAGNVGIALVADVNAASINATHRVASFQWINNVDAASELAYIDGNGGYVNSYPWAIGTTPTDGLTLDNTTAAALGAQQYSPAIHLGGNCWETTGGTSQSVDWRIYNVPVQGATATTTLYFDSSVNGAAYVNRATLTTGATFTTSYLVGTAVASGVISGSAVALDGYYDRSTGLGTAGGLYQYAGDYPLTLVSTSRTDAASAKVFVSCYDRNAASITNAATMRIHSFGWTNNADSFTELAYVRADGLIHAEYGFDSTRAWALGSTPVDGLALVNTTAAADSAQQWSPYLHLGGRYWSGAASAAADWFVAVQPVQNASGRSVMNWYYSFGGAGKTTFMSFDTSSNEVSIIGYLKSTAAVCAYFGASSDFIGGVGDQSTGLGTTAFWKSTSATNEVALISGITDAASAVCMASVYDRNAASITNAATMRIHSFGWTTNADAYTELQYMRADGAFVCASGSLSAGIQPTGLSTDFGVATTAATDTLSLWSVRTNGSGNISHAIVADVNNATINADHKVLSIGWVNNSDTYTELFAFKDGQIVYSNVTGGMEFWSDEADGGSAVAFTVGSTSSWTTAGAKLFSVVNTDPAGYERFYVGYNGDVCMNKGNNAQCLTVKSLTESLTIAAAATTTAVNQIPQYAIVLAVSVRVTTVIPTATDFDVGVSGDAVRYGEAINVAAGTTNPGTQDAARYYNAATSIIITPQASPAAATGVVRLTIHYVEITPPQS